jgi:hypothetical protein
MKKEVIFGILFLLAVFCAYAEPNIDLGAFSVTSPKITVTYSQPVKITPGITTLTYLDDASIPPYVLCITPNPASSNTYNREYILVPTQGGSTTGCTAASQPLAAGKYLLTISAEDASGMQSQANPPDRRTFTLQGLSIDLVTPKTGVGTTNPVPVTFRTHEVINGADTDRLAICKWTAQSALLDPAKFDSAYSTMTAIGSSPSSTHSLQFPGRGTLQVLCKESTGRYTYAKFPIDFDSTAPRITALNATPPIVTDPGRKYTAITLQTDDASVCTIQPVPGTASPFPRNNANDSDPKGPAFEDPSSRVAYMTYHETVQTYNIADELQHNFSYKITCTNLAGLSASRTIDVAVQLGAGITVESPASLLTSGQFTLRISASFTPQSCSVNGKAMAADPADDQSYTAAFDLPDGKYALQISCTTAAKTVSATRDITIDSTPPGIPVLQSGDALCNGQLVATFSAADAGKNFSTGVVQYNYTVADNNGWSVSGVTGSNRVSITPPATLGDTLTWSVFAVDGAGNAGMSNQSTYTNIHPGEDEECGLPPFITLLEPAPMGYSTKVPYTLKIGTARQSACVYRVDLNGTWSNNIPLQTANGIEHTRSLSFAQQRLKVNCTEPAGKQHQKIIMVGSDATAPLVGINVSPSSTITDRADSILTIDVRTDDLAYCTLNGTSISGKPDSDLQAYEQVHTAILDLTNAPDGARTLTITCKNLAQLNTTMTQNIVVDYNAALTISVLSPAAYTSLADSQLRVQPSKQSTCTYQRNATSQQLPMGASGGVHSADIGSLSDGSHSLLVTCTAIADGESATRAVDFTIDRNGPVITAVNGPSSICPANATATYAVEYTSIDTAPKIQYALSGVNASYATNSSMSYTLPGGLQPGAYTLTVTVINRAGMQSAPSVNSFDVLDASAPACSAPVDHCSNGVQDTGETAIDCGGTCAQCVACLLDTDCMSPEQCLSSVCVSPTCITDDECTGTEVCTSGVCVQPTITGCTSDSQCAGGQCVSGACSEPPSGSCTTNNDCLQGELCALGTCVQPTSNASCTDSSQCPSDSACFAGVCVPQPAPVELCSDGTQDGDETGLDCGGSCDACQSCTADTDCPAGVCIQDSCVDPGTHTACTSDADCIGQTCQQGICIGANIDFCTDGIQDNGETDVDCGGSCNACQTCTDAYSCDASQQCSSAGNCVPLPRASCFDGIINGDETGVDCGGATCAPCAASGGITCNDGVLNGDEQDVDCGGSCPVSCYASEQPPVCSNGVLDEGEEEIDCGGMCTECPKSNLIAILLMAFGVAIMGAAAYFLYQQHEGKKIAASNYSNSYSAPQFQQARTSPQFVQPMNPALEAKYTQEQAQRQQALREAYAKRMEEKQSQRKELFSSFGADAQKPQAAQAAEPPKKDEFVDVTKLKKEKKDDPFGKLDNLASDTEKKNGK